MRLCWLFTFLLGCRLSRATESNLTSDCNWQLQIYCFPENGTINVFVPCPNVTGEEMSFNLFKDVDEIYNYKCKKDKKSQKCHTEDTRSDVRPHMDGEGKFVGFTLVGETTSSHGPYRCQSVFQYPPPLVKHNCADRVIALVKGHHSQCNNNSSNRTEGSKDTGETQDFWWVWIVVVALLSVYSVAATISALVCWLKVKKTDSQSDYMNTKPRAPRDRKKKKGLQNPIPRYF